MNAVVKLGVDLQNGRRLAKWQKLARSVRIDPETGCHVFTGALNSDGYGRLHVQEGERPVTKAVHRIAWEIEFGPIPDGLVLDHLCRNRACCNPFHLDAVTHRENILRGDGLAAHQSRQTHCRAGHPLIPENLYVYGTSRVCKACRIEERRKRRYRVATATAPLEAMTCSPARGRKREPLRDRLAARLVPDPATGCLVFTGPRASGGYGNLTADDGRTVRVHRAAYEFAKGPIPPGLVIDHLCRNRLCCNPDHLEAVTPRENAIRGDGWAGKNARRTHCDAGHELDGWYPSRGRFCRTCHSAAQRAKRLTLTHEAARRFANEIAENS